MARHLLRYGVRRTHIVGPAPAKDEALLVELYAVLPDGSEARLGMLPGHAVAQIRSALQEVEQEFPTLVGEVRPTVRTTVLSGTGPTDPTVN